MYVLWRNDHSLCGDVMCVCRQNRAHAAADRVAEIQAKEKSRMQVHTIIILRGYSVTFMKTLKFSSLLQSLANSISRGFFLHEK